LDGDSRTYWQQQQQQPPQQWTPPPDPHYRPVNAAYSRHHSPSPGVGSVEVCEQGHNALKVRTADCGPHLVSLGSGRLSTNITLIHLPEGNYYLLVKTNYSRYPLYRVCRRVQTASSIAHFPPRIFANWKSSGINSQPDRERERARERNNWCA
jgi:hypothetical protein